MYAASYREHPLTFEVAGVWRRNLIVRDRETGTLWQQATGWGLIGPLEGTQLRPLTSALLTWRAWRAAHDASTWVGPGSDWAGLLPQSTTRHVLRMLDPFFRAAGLSKVDRRLAPTEEVIGLTIGGADYAYPLAQLRGRTLLHDFVAGVPLTLLYDAGTDRVVVLVRPFDALRPERRGDELVSDEYGHRWGLDGQQRRPESPPLAPLPFARLYWAGWYEFHPRTLLYRSEPRT